MSPELAGGFLTTLLPGKFINGFILFLIIIIFRWGSTDTSRVYFGGVLWENAECQDRTGEADLHRCLWWGLQMRGEIWGFYQVFQNWVLSLPEAVTCCRLWIFECLVWAKEKFTNLLLFPGYDKIRLIGGLGAQWIMHFLPKTKIRVSEKQHWVEVQGTDVHLARANLTLRFCHLPAAWVWADDSLSCPHLS